MVSGRPASHPDMSRTFEPSCKCTASHTDNHLGYKPNQQAHPSGRVKLVPYFVVSSNSNPSCKVAARTGKHSSHNTRGPTHLVIKTLVCVDAPLTYIPRFGTDIGGTETSFMVSVLLYDSRSGASLPPSATNEFLNSKDRGNGNIPRTDFLALSSD